MSTDENHRAQATSQSLSWVPHLQWSVGFTLLGLLIVAVQPAMAQTGTVCNAEKLPAMIEGFFQLTTGIGIVGLAVIWQADSLIGMFTLNPDQKKNVKQHKRSALKSSVTLVTLGPLYTVAGTMMGLPLADCVDLVPW